MRALRDLRPGRTLVAALGALGLLVTGPGAASAAGAPAVGNDPSLPTTVGTAHILWGSGHYAGNANQDNLIYHGGAVETTPAVYVVYWGTEWQKGFSVQAGGYTYTQQSAMNYVTTFFRNVGGTPWAGVQTQYCQGAAVGAFNCNGYLGAQFVTNPRNQLKGVWIDPSPVPAEIVTTALAENTTDDAVAVEAKNAAAHFGFNNNATYMIFTPPGHAATAYGSVYCAFHSETGHPYGARGIKYAFMPYTPEQGAGCGGNSVNATNDAFGHGYFDSYSLAGGHEYAEAVTDPDNFNGTQDGWNDAQTSENGDKCAYKFTKNVQFGPQYFAVQPMWSNAYNNGAGGCAFSL